MDENEAITKFCPHMRVTLEHGRAFSDPSRMWTPAHNVSIENETGGVSEYRNCIASDCMMWKFYDDKDKVRGGYCGLVGE